MESNTINVMVQVGAALDSIGRLFSQSNQDFVEAGDLFHSVLYDLSCDSRSKERCGADPTCSIGVRQSVAKPSAFAADPKQGKMRGVMPTKQMHASQTSLNKQMHTSQTSLNMEGTEIRRNSGPRAQELRHAQLAMERASERAKELCAISLAHSKELQELKELLPKETLAAKLGEETITKIEEQIAQKEKEFDNSRKALSKATYVISEARKIIENVRGPLQAERVQSVALFISPDKLGRTSSLGRTTSLGRTSSSDKLDKLGRTSSSDEIQLRLYPSNR